MKFFATVKLAKFASELLGAAGFDLAALQAAGDTKALAAAIAKKSPTAITADEAMEASLNEAFAENESLTARLAQATARTGLLVKALNSAGIKLAEAPAGAKDEEISSAMATAISGRVAILAAEQLAAAGHPPVSEVNPDDPTQAKKTLNRAAFAQLRPAEQAAFCAQIRAGKAVLTD